MNNFTAVPRDVIREHMPDLTGAELKCLLYVVDHTVGWQKDADRISISQFRSGITKSDGTVLDRETGLSRSAVKQALNRLENRRLIVRTRELTRSGNYPPTEFRLAAETERANLAGDQGRTQEKPSLDTSKTPQETSNQNRQSNIDTGSASSSSLPTFGWAASPRDLENSTGATPPAPSHEDIDARAEVVKRLSDLGVHHASDLVDAYVDGGRTVQEVAVHIENVLQDDAVRTPAAVLTHRLQDGYPAP